MKHVVIIGAGGHGREVAEIIGHQHRVNPASPQVLGFVDDNPDLAGSHADNFPVLGPVAWLETADREQISVVCAIGTPPVCKRLTERARRIGYRFHSAISPLALLSPLASCGEGVTIFPGVVMNTASRLGDHCILNIASSVSHDSEIGPCCNINPGVRLAGNVSIGEGCYVGMGTQVIQGKRVGSWTTIGAGAVVVRDIPSHVTAVGVPARIIKSALHQVSA
jgi:sugar O-acyltransferase (sialic acid O-acetyltransferase NeuD family)